MLNIIIKPIGENYYELVLEAIALKNILAAIKSLNKFWGIRNDCGWSAYVEVNGIDLSSFIEEGQEIFHLGIWDIPKLKGVLGM